MEFKNVSFSYNKDKGKTRDDLSDINFALKRGETLGIIGPTGSGKSTILSLLMRFYDVDSGEIRINGKRIEGIPDEELHTMFGVVFQNDFILADSIRENVDFGRGISDEDLLIAAKFAQADFIETKEGGLSHMLTAKGSNLSGGQKQRLLIARALAGKPEILVLDDCSSASITKRIRRCAARCAKTSAIRLPSSLPSASAPSCMRITSWCLTAAA